jgi:hypothetical protein
MQSLLKNLFSFILALAFMAGLYNSRFWLQAHENKSDLPKPEIPRVFAFDPQFLDIVSLGHRAVVHDFMEIWLLDKFLSSSYRFNEDETAEVLKYVEKQRPRMESTYLFLCFVFMEMQKAEYCERILSVGIDAFPNSWRLPMTGGFVEMKIFNRPLQAAKYYFLASSREKSPKFVASLAQKLIAEQTFSDTDYDESLKLIFGQDTESKFRQFFEQHSAKKR